MKVPAKHAYKYRAVYVVNGERVVGFDNERGKGDHCHLDGKERPYCFTTVEQLVEDFVAAVAEDIVVLAELGLLERTETGGDQNFRVHEHAKRVEIVDYH